MINHFEQIRKIYDFYIENIKIFLEYTEKYIQTKNESLVGILSIIKYIYNNPNIIVIIIGIISLLFSSFVLGLLFIFILFDSLILSLFVLSNINIEKYSKKISKNILSLFILYFNPIGSIMTLIIVTLLYSNISKFINKLIIKLFENFTLLVCSFLPFISLLYPDTIMIKNNNLEDLDDIDITDLFDDSSTILSFQKKLK